MLSTHAYSPELECTLWDHRRACCLGYGRSERVQYRSISLETDWMENHSLRDDWSARNASRRE